MRTQELFRGKTYLSGVLLMVCILLLTLGARYLLLDNQTVYEGTYPGIRGIIEPVYEFEPDRVVLRLPEETGSKQLVVFVYDTDGNQFGMLKDIRNGSITITPADYPEYMAGFSGNKVEGYKIFKRINGRGEGERFLTRLQRAKENGLRFGVQQCMYPVCTRCLDVCPVISKGVIEMHQAPGGQILPVVLYGACPRSGKCFTVCSLGAFYKADLRHVQRNPKNTVKLATELHPKTLQ